MIQTDYTTLEKETDTVSFNDDELELTGRSITAFSYKGERHIVGSWKSMLVQLCKLIYEEEPIQMNSLAAKNFWLHKDLLEGRSFIAEGCTIYSSCSTKTKCSILNYTFDQLGLNPVDLEFELTPLNDNVTEGDEL